jgi:hypothetical protein
VLTHCNTGSLATAGYGTALGVIRTLAADKRLGSVYCTETRPFNQGARLTAFELVHDGLEPATLIADSAAAALMASGRVDAVVVGADRVAANGDTANKIGTYALAVAAQFHGARGARGVQHAGRICGQPAALADARCAACRCPVLRCRAVLHAGPADARWREHPHRGARARGAYARARRARGCHGHRRVEPRV